MNSRGGTTNTAALGSAVGIQAEQVHNSTVYNVLPDDPPEQKYQVGLRYLDNGVPSRARDLIGEAIAHNYENAEVRFHWVLAMLSKRSYRDLSADERVGLACLPEHLAKYTDSEWKRALQTVVDLINQLDMPAGDPGGALADLMTLGSTQRDKIVRHCDLLLTGSIKDHFWAENHREAERKRLAGDRINRVWAYFQPEPIEPRALRPAGDASTAGDRIRAGLATIAVAAALGCVGSVILEEATPIPIIAYLVALASGCIAARNGFEWQYRVHRLDAKEREYIKHLHASETPSRGFANRVAHSFEHYAHKYPPTKGNTTGWLQSTRSFRAILRDEIVNLYGDSRIPIGRVNWLIRYLVRQVGKQWREKTLFEYRKRLRTPLPVKAWCLGCLLITVLVTCVVIVTAFRIDPLTTAIAAVTGVVSGRIATLSYSRIFSERRRIAEEDQEYQRAMEDRRAEHTRWKKKLDSTCPSEREMEAWLQCDRTLLINEALRHYRLAWRDVIAHAIVQTPAETCKRARVSGGPWRYSEYDLHLFLITSDGVRELTRQLDFEKASFHGHRRGNFRFDAVSSLHVVKAGEYDYTLDLTLTNGPSRTIRVAEPVGGLEHDASDEPGVSEVSLDSAGFAHALHVLEGIAAEGKAWIERSTPHAETITVDAMKLSSLN